MENGVLCPTFVELGSSSKRGEAASTTCSELPKRSVLQESTSKGTNKIKAAHFNETISLFFMVTPLKNDKKQLYYLKTRRIICFLLYLHFQYFLEL